MSSKNGTTLSYDSMNRLTAWGNQSYTYDSKGNITHQPSVGNFSYNGFRVTDMSAENDYIIDDSLRISYYKAIERPKSIENEHYRADFFYDGDGDRYMMKVYERHAEGDSLLFTRYYMDANAEVTKDTLGHYTHLYYAGGDAYTAPAVMVIDETGQTATYQITRDNLGSAIQYASKNGVRYRYSYSPWGVRTHQVGGNTVFYQPGDDSPFGPFYRTYTGHEDLWMFGLINANARLYNPYLGRFISPDPLLNSEGGPLDYNPYIYARNNPYKYIDRNGEFPWLIPVMIGGFAFAAANFDHIDNLFEFAGSFACGAVATGLSIGVGVVVGGAVTAGVGAIGVSVGSPVIAAAAPFVGAGVGAAAGYVSYNLTYSGLSGTPFNFSWKDMGIEVGIAVATVGAGKIASKLASKGSKIMQTRHRPIAAEPDKIAAKAKADKALLPVSESLSGNDSWELLESRAVSRYSSDGNVVKILRPEINGYDKCLIKTDMHHVFPYSFDEDVVKYGFSKVSKNGDSFGYILPGYHAGEAGFFHINMNKQNMIYHRSFYKWADRFDMYVGKKGVDEVYFFER